MENLPQKKIKHLKIKYNNKSHLNNNKFPIERIIGAVLGVHDVVDNTFLSNT
jgi:hypothetical protein